MRETIVKQSLASLRRLGGYAGLAADAARVGRTQRVEFKGRATDYVVQRMGRLRGLPQKLGQMLSVSTTSADAPKHYAALQEAADPLPWTTVKPLLESAWSRPVETVLRDVVEYGQAASLGQVHRATLHDGRAIAVKVQYPNIRADVWNDLRMLGWLSKPVGNLRRGFDLSAYRDVITADMEEELDYGREAASQREFYDWASQSDDFAVPQVVPEWCRDTVLVTAWESGTIWEDVKKDWPRAEKRRASAALATLLLDGLFRKGLVHADWHPGNFRFRSSTFGPPLLLYDFGSVYRPDLTTRLTLLRLIRATCRHDESPLPLFLNLGFRRDFLEPMADKLPAVSQLLFAPFLAEHPFDFRTWRLSERIGDVLGEDRWNFRIAGPPALVFLLRVFHGLNYFQQGLDTPIHWRPSIENLLTEFGPSLDRLPIDSTDQLRPDFSTLARFLKVRVRRGGKTVVQLKQNAAAVDDLADLLDDEVKNKIAARSIELREIIRSVRSRGYAPGPVFELKEGEKEVRVWLE